ncbi:glycosyltransferase family 25 protein [Hymenobacter sp. DG01]|uniref:glycosyltransferase family 25 protein n=1 Tax=Hymenobacter sp. DG01 TaxID=2584940 RepID=UPI00112283F0|nr:glycosyltransferase family 25 protein [Hymenobacter sp. DG01]
MKKIKAFVINLPSAVERRINIEKQLIKYNIDYEIIEAVNGKNLLDNDSRIDLDFVKENAYWVSKGALACSLSHVSVYEKILNDNIDLGLIFEDDSNINADIIDIVSNINNNDLNKNEIVLLYYAAWKKITLLKNTEVKINNCYSIFDSMDPRQLVSANAYIITNDACRTMLEYQSPVKSTADSWGKFIDNGAVESIRCIYPFAVEPADFKSSIDYVAVGSIKGMLLEIIDRYRVYPLYNIMKKRREIMRKRMLNIEFV